MPRTARPRQCQLCDHPIFTRPNALVYHMVAVHGQVRDRYVCDICDTSFLRKGDLTTHTKEQHLHTRRYPCRSIQPDGRLQGCDRVFAQKRSLLRHLRSEGQDCWVSSAVLLRQEEVQSLSDRHEARRDGNPTTAEPDCDPADFISPSTSKSSHHSNQSLRRSYSHERYDSKMTWTGSHNFSEHKIGSTLRADLCGCGPLNHDSPVNLQVLTFRTLAMAATPLCFSIVRPFEHHSHSALDAGIPYKLFIADIYHELLQLGRRLMMALRGISSDSRADAGDLRYSRLLDFLVWCVHLLGVYARCIGDSPGLLVHLSAAAAIQRSDPLIVSWDYPGVRWSDVWALTTSKARLCGVDEESLRLPLGWPNLLDSECMGLIVSSEKNVPSRFLDYTTWTHYADYDEEIEFVHVEEFTE